MAANHALVLWLLLVPSLWAGDPATRFSTFLGGSWNDAGNAIAVDSAGYVYVAGETESRDFPVTPGALRTVPRPRDKNHRPLYIGFVAKLDPTGRLVWSTYLGGSSVETIQGVAVDAAGSVYITGSTESRDFPTASGAVQPSFGGGGQPGDAFVVKLSPSGDRVVYATFLGGNGSDFGSAIAIDHEGSAYVTGYTMSTNFPATQRIAPGTARSHEALLFVCKLNPDGRRILYSTVVPADGGDRVTGIAVDTKGQAYVTGVTHSPDFPTTVGTYRGAGDVFAIKLTSQRGTLVYSMLLGGSNEDSGGGIAVDDFGAAYIAGSTQSHDFPTTTGAVQPGFGGGASDGFVAKIAPSGDGLDYSTYLGGKGYEDLYSIALDGQRNALVTGRKSAAGRYPETSGALKSERLLGECMVLSKINPGGRKLLFSRQYCADNPNPIFSVVVGKAIAAHGPSAYVTGWTTGHNFPTTEDVVQPRFRGGHEPFVLQIAPRE